MTPPRRWPAGADVAAPTARRTLALVALAVVALALAVVGGPGPADAQDGTSSTTDPTLPPGATRAVETFTGADGTDRQVLITRPKGADGSTPAVVLIHGGGWYSGTPSDMEPWADLLADQGWVAFSIGYRLAEQGGGSPSWPEAFDDVQAGTRWVHANAARYGGDPDELIVFGESAGAHLTALLAEQGAGDDDVAIRAAAWWSAPLDLAQLVPPAGGGPVPGCGGDPQCEEFWSLGPDPGPALWFVGCRPDDCPSTYAAATPLGAVDADMPPVWFANSTDELVPLPPAQELARQLAAAGVDHHLEVVPGEAHAHGYAARVWNEMVPWLADRVGQDRPAPVSFPGRSGDRRKVLAGVGAAVLALGAGLGMAAWHVRRNERDATTGRSG